MPIINVTSCSGTERSNKLWMKFAIKIMRFDLFDSNVTYILPKLFNCLNGRLTSKDL